METIAKFENTMEGWFKSVPHLPENGRKWLAKNAWLITLIGLVLSALAILSIAWALFAALTAVSVVSSYMAAYGVSAYSTTWTISTIISLLALIAVVILTAISIKPLKAMNKKGWDLLFMAFLVSAVISIISSVVNFSVYGFFSSLIGAVIGLGIGLYFLFEIKSYFKKISEAAKTSKTA